MEPYVAVMLVAFLLGWALLYRSKVERFYGVFYVIRSGYGIRLIDAIARFRPGLWAFMADFSVLLSFGGMGAYYLSCGRETRESLWKSILLAGLIAAVLGWYVGFTPLKFSVPIVAAAVAVLVMRLLCSAFTDFIVSSSFISVVFLSFTGNVFYSTLMGVFGIPAVLIYFLVSHALSILYGRTDLPGVSPLVPTSRGGSLGVFFPGYDIFIPWWYAFVAIAVTLVSHEGAHGVLTRVCGVRLKSTGILTAGSMPVGAFVEPDEDTLNGRPSVDRMRVYTIGSFANLVVGLLALGFILLSMNLLSDYIDSNGMRIVGFIEGYPAKDVLEEDSVIYSVNGVPTLDLGGFRNATSGMVVGEEVVLNTSAGVFSLRAGEDKNKPGEGYMGVYVLEDVYLTGTLGFLDIEVVSFFMRMLEWIIFFNVNIALVNLLPIIPFDGGRMFVEVMSTLNLNELNVKRVLYAVIAFTAVVFVVNTIPLFFMIIGYAYELLGLV